MHEKKEKKKKVMTSVMHATKGMDKVVISYGTNRMVDSVHKVNMDVF